jgi:hypothetical protein
MRENQMESCAGTVIEYLPMESVIVPLPDVLITPTASSGRRADRSYTVPLMVTCCARTDPDKMLAMNRTNRNKQDDLKAGVYL